MDKSALSPEEQIEYYLGKDRLPNLHWQPEIPKAWEILPRLNNPNLCNPSIHNITVTVGDGIEYRFNNLGYRSNFDYNLDELKNKDLILILGDSDAMARGVDYNSMYSSRIQCLTDLTVVNLGIAGLSPDGMTRIGVQSILGLGSAVKHVCVLWPIFSLREFVSKTYKGGVHKATEDKPYDNWWDHIDWVSNNYNYQKNRILLEQTTKNTGAQYHDLIINWYDKKSPNTYNTMKNGAFKAFTVETHNAIGNYFIKKINNQPSLYQQITQS